MIETDQATFARITGVTTQAVRLWQTKGMPGISKPTRNSFYVDLEVAIPWVKDNVWANADDRARKLQAEADLAVFERDLQNGRLMLVADAEKEWGNILAGIRARLLAIPPKVGALLGSNLTVAERAEVVRREIYEALDNLSGPPEPMTEEPEEPQEQPTIRKKPGRQKKAK